MDEKRYAVLIDADNSSHQYIGIVMDEVSREGVITYKRIYGDWANPQLKSYKEILLEHAVTPIQQYSYTVGKNATDSALIIDAMDILYTGQVEGFCIVSSDSDFTKLACRLREAGMNVIGMGRSQTPKPFVKACNSFKFLDALLKDRERTAQEERTAAAPAAEQNHAGQGEPVDTVDTGDTGDTGDTAEDSRTPEREIRRAIVSFLQESDEEEGWVLVSLVGTQLQKKYPDFDPRNYGCRKTVDFLDKLGFDIKKCPDPNNLRNPNSSVVYVRIRP